MAKKTIKTSGAETLVVRDLGDEVVIYDTEDNRCHVLNPAAAIAWRRCEETETIEDLAAAIASKTGLPADTDVAYLALEELAAAGLLEAAVAIPPVSAGVSRRQMLLGMVGAAATLPVVASLLIGATPAMAATTTTAAPEPEPTLPPNVVTEPSTLSLLAVGTAAVIAAVAHRRKKPRKE